MKIIIDNKIPFIKGRLEPFAEVAYADPASVTPEMVRDADALITRTRTRCDRFLLEGSAVKLVATATIGTDHIDLAWCEANGIRVENAAGCNAPGVAQYVWSSIIRNGFNPSRHTLGVVGLGHIGSIVADWGRKLGCRVLVCDPPRKKAGLRDEDYIPLHDLLGKADAVTIHTPLTHNGEDPTFHLFGEEEFSLMRKGAILVNAARGPVVDNEAWLSHLRSDRESKAVIDVWENEPSISLPLLAEATVATPHIAGYSLEGKQRATRMAIEATGRFFGFSPDISGLTADYSTPASVSATEITESYDPAADTAMLKKNPDEFENLRSIYDYRHEPGFNS